MVGAFAPRRDDRAGERAGRRDRQATGIDQAAATRAAFAVSSGFSGYTIPYRDEIVGDIGTPLFILQVGVLLVLLIVRQRANLQLIRATARHKELAIRTALGAGEWALIRQLLIEGLVLSIAGGLLGIAAGFAGMRALLSLGTTQLPRAGEVSLDATVLLFTVALAVVTGIIFGLAPGLTLVRGRVQDVLKEDSRGASANRRASFTRHLVVGEMALALVLLIGGAAAQVLRASRTSIQASATATS